MTRAEVAVIIGILRKVTTLVKVLPFIGAIFYLIGILGYFFLPDVVIDIIDLTFYLSPLSVAFLLALSKTLHLCRWHRLECVIPLVASIPFLIDKFFTPVSPYANIDVIGIIVLISASFINAYFVFIRPQR